MGLNLRIKNRVWFLLILFGALRLIPAIAVEAHRYTLDELELMAKRKVWNQLVLYLHDVPPVERHQQWESLVERSSTGYLERLKASGVSEVEKVAQDLLREYPSLERSIKFNKIRDQILIEGFERCYASPGDAPECTKRLIIMLKEKGMTNHFKEFGAQLALKHSPESIKELCSFLLEQAEVGGNWKVKCK